MSAPLNVLGIMSGSSLDGLDFALVEISKIEKWSYRLIKAETIKYPQDIVSTLLKMGDMKLYQYVQNDNNYTKFICDNIIKFISGHSVNLISSHGHTVFHQPEKGITFQCGNPTMIAALTGIDTVGNFRQLDVYCGGQGAPLVPFGEQLFEQAYKDIDIYLNLGGICNIGSNGTGWDIGFCNMYSNKLAQQLGKEYDEDGVIGGGGKINSQFLEFLKAYQKVNKIKHEKSFGRQHFDQFINDIDNHCKSISIPDKLRTYYQYLSWIITNNIQQLINLHQINKQQIKVLCTGGGAYNKFLIHLLNQNQKLRFQLPDKEVIQFKQAIIFAFLGVKYLHSLNNCSKGIGGVMAKGSNSI